MGRARTRTQPNERGNYVTYCDHCDASDEFPDVVMAIQARRMHLCSDEIPSASWPGWDLVAEDGYL